MLIKIYNYPDTFEIKTNVELPKYKYGCKQRKKILLSNLEEQKIHSPNHSYEDYIIEEVETYKKYEVWHLGS